MSHFALTTEKLAMSVARSAAGVLLLTSVHYAYGAYLYDTLGGSGLYLLAFWPPPALSVRRWHFAGGPAVLWGVLRSGH